MDKKSKNSLFSGVPSWALSLMTFFASIVFWLLFGENQLSAMSTYDIVIVIGYVLFITAASFFICRRYPKSVWHTPFICSGLLILLVLVLAFADADMSTEVTIMCGILVLPITGAIVGANFGRRRAIKSSVK